MAQGYTGYNIIDNAITYKDSANLDAFSRLRVSNPLTIFSNQFTYDKSPYVYEEITNNNPQTDAKYDTTERIVKLQIKPGSLAGDYMYMQSYEYIPYQPGRSQLVFLTFNFFPSPVSSTAPPGTSDKVIGLSDGSNGFEFVYDVGLMQPCFVIRTTTSAGIQIVDQPNWNLDRLDGTGPSGITLNLYKTQILVIDFQALYVGRVRMGFDIDGTIVYAHEFLHANSFNFPYIMTANLPVRAGIISQGAGLDDEMFFICASVASEGGTEDAQRFGYNFVYTGSYINLPVGLTYVFTLSPALLFGGITNRVKFVLESVEFMNVGTKPAQWSLGIGSALTTPTWNNVNLNTSSMQYDTTAAAAGALSVVIDGGYVAAGTAGRAGISSEAVSSKYPISLSASGAKRDNGNLTLFATAIGGNTDFYYSIKWKEIR